MKCPKCGYNSFEFLDICKKCNSDLTAFKQTHGIRAIIIPPAAVASTPAQTSASADVIPPTPPAPASSGETTGFTWEMPAQPAAVKQGDDIFSDLDLGLPQPPPPAPPHTAAPAAAAAEPAFDDFSFDDEEQRPPAEEQPSDDAFAALLETAGSNAGKGDASEQDGIPWDFGSGESEEKGTLTDGSGAADEFDLTSFSWGDEEKPAPADNQAKKQPEPHELSSREFDTLFGEAEETAQHK